MNRRIICAILIIVMTVCLCSCADSSNKIRSGEVYAGMSYTDFMTITDGKGCFQYIGYAFYETADGYCEVVRVNGEYTSVEEVRSFRKAKTDRSVKSFESIQQGMTIWEVVEKVGLPYGTETFGAITLDFRANNGSTYTIYWQRTETDLTVQSVNHR